MAASYRLLFVCLGNICRSPSAENIMNYLIDQRGLGDLIECDSAGTSSYHVGSPPDRRMNVAAQRQLGIQLKGRARQFQPYDFDEFDLILAMDQDNYENLYYLDRQGQYRDKLRLMCEFCTQHDLKEVPDPYYGGEAGFNFVIDLLMDACSGLLDHLKASGKI
ncbi:low molecular weight protein-tyrosine-phosphatase [Alkalinema sp. FACHB-956]|uniref:low molecular weight protein-tyrosine-phosphatase n=1 Tax=Alkalinema sp. FACHB-956 TaxID=2692768 RepID=UPI001684D6EA|nr:low molecular weight protein-tyrosine-phosphatase [Alkalinema sp. FACHB-956]MBD2326382.1 low molecular weight phosphotyrosine protein phosphatase [Alkalinema sp. FACHB-956]